MIVTGIGARKTPPHVLEEMTQIGEWCRENRIPLRSGHAEGADWAFESGAQEVCIAYLPWRSFNAHLKSAARRHVYTSTLEVEEIVAEIHPNPKALTSGAFRLQGRNVYQILGTRLVRPSSVVVCWTPGGRKVGGTASALTLAGQHDIPVYNLATTPLAEVMAYLEELLVLHGGTLRR